MDYLINEALYKSILDSSTDLIFLKSPTFTHLMINQAFADYFGKSTEEIIGLTDYDLMPKQFADTCRLSDQEAIEQNRPCVQVELVDSEYWETCKFPVRLPDGNIGVGGIIRNITQARKQEKEIKTLYDDLEERVMHRTQELERINKELEAFAYSVSHDLKTPLRAIDGFSGLLQERVKGKIDPESTRYLQVVRDNTKRMDQLIKDLLFFSRASRTELKVAELDMMSMVRIIFDELNDPDDPKRITLVVHTLPYANGDPSLMRQVWINLIDNAMKYTKHKTNPRIEIGSYPEEGKQIFYIRDNGVGFKPEYTRKLFGVFHRLHSNDEFEGTGVGLAIVQRIIQRHGGSTWGEGKVGDGAKFFFSLPINKKAISMEGSSG